MQKQRTWQQEVVGTSFYLRFDASCAEVQGALVRSKIFAEYSMARVSLKFDEVKSEKVVFKKIIHVAVQTLERTFHD